jgi:O-antigen/teichoic acid export membrane protein
MFATWKQYIGGALPKGSVARRIVTLASGTAAAQAITAGVMPVVTRLYTPTQIGVISVFLAFFNFWSPALSLRYEYALLNAQSDAESHVVNRLAVLCVAGMSLLAMPVLAALHQFKVLGFGLLPWWSSIAAVPILYGYGQFMVCRSWGLRAGAVGYITKSTMARSAANAATRIGMGVMGGGIPGLFAAELAGSWGSAATLYRTVHSHFAASQPAVISPEMLKTTMRRYIKFPAFETPSTFVNQLAMTLPVPMIASLYGPAAAGWFGLARAMVAIPNTQIGTAVGDVFQMELARAVLAGDRERGRQLFYKMMAKLALFGLLPLAGVVLLAPWVMAIVFGAEWREAGLIAAAIAPWMYAALVVSSLSRLLSVLQAQEYKLAYDTAATLLFVTIFIAAKHLQLALMPTVLWLSAGAIFSYLLYLAILIVVVESRLKND